MGVAILRGVIASQRASLATRKQPSTEANPSSSSSSPQEQFIFTRFIACVNRTESVTALKSKVAELTAPTTTTNPTSPTTTNVSSELTVEVWQRRALEACQAADVILLSCQPSQAAAILAGADMAAALSGKILLSICVGLSLSQLEAMIQYPDAHAARCVLVHAMPNTASTLRESSTVVSQSSQSLGTSPSGANDDATAIAHHVLSSIGLVIPISSSLMPAASVTAASTPAFFALALQGVIEGAVAKGVPRHEATVMAAQAMRGAAGMVLAGESPAELMEKVMTPGGCTERGVRVLQSEKIDAVFADATAKGIERVFEMSREREAKKVAEAV